MAFLRPRWAASSLVGLLTAATACCPAAASAQSPGGPVDPSSAPPSEVIVRYKTGTDAGERAAARDAADVEHDEGLPAAEMEVVDPDPGVSVRESIAALERSDDVAYAEPDVRRSAFATPDDSFFPMLWAMRNAGQTVGGTPGLPDADIDADQAWDTTTGSSGVVVGVVDTGLDVSHPDLAANVWSNAGETGGGRESNGLDDDGDGLIDDRMGWDWVGADNQPLDENGHGSHVSGTIAGHGNDGTGVAGVAWHASLMPLRVLDANGSGSVSDAIKAYGYAAAHGARVVNASLGGSSSSRAERDAIAAASKVLFVVAAGNDGADNDTTASYPCDYPLANVVCVAATDQRDALASFSNFGAATVDLAAPGVHIASAWPGARWALLDGTSMATPHVAGTAVLALAANPALNVAGLRSALLSSTDPLPGLSGRVATGGRLNAAKAVAAATGSPPPPPDATASTQSAPAAPGQPAAPAAPQPGAPGATAPATQAPAAVTAPARAPDRIAPTLRLTVPGRAEASRGVRVTARCSERCTVRVRLVASAATARRLGLPRHATTLARAEVRISRAGARTRTVRLGAALRRRLARSGTVRITVAAEAADLAGNRRAASVHSTLRAR